MSRNRSQNRRKPPLKRSRKNPRKKCQGNIRNGKAQGRIPVYIPQYRDEDGNLLAKVEYYFTAKHSLSELLKDEKALKVVDEMAERLIQSHILQDVTFATDKSFLSPRNASALKGMMGRIKEWREKYPEGKMTVFWHTDAVGKEDYNKKLSERRANSVHSFLVKDPVVWKKLYDEEKWGLASTQEAKDFDVIDGKPFAGCSEFNLAAKTEGASEPNRRVAVLLLKSNKNFPIQYPCKHGDVGPCRKQKDRKGERRTAGFGCLFYDKLVREEKGGGKDPVKVGPFKFKDIEEAEIKQYVNLPAGTVGQGIERLIEVEAEGAPDGTEVFWKITAGEKNSNRNVPKTGAKISGKDPVIEFKDMIAEASSKTTGAKASLVICCGAAGGDTFTVEAEAPECSVFKSEQLGLPAGKKGYVLTDHTFKSYPKIFDKGMAPRSIGLKLCNKNYFYESANMLPIRKVCNLVSPDFKVAVDVNSYFVPKSAEDGLDSVKLFTWKAMVDPVANPGHPGLIGGKARTGVLDSSIIRLITTSEFEFTLPTANLSDPGNLVGPTVTVDRCPIRVTIEFEGASEGLGLAGQGAQEGENLVVYNAGSPDCFVDVLLHELGHSMGQTVYKNIYDPPKGMEIPKKTSEEDAGYAHNGTKGHTYVGKGHSGSHCAYGLTDADKGQADYGNMPGTCIMFGENSGKDPSSATTGFCPLCIDYIKGRNLFDLGLLEDAVLGSA